MNDVNWSGIGVVWTVLSAVVQFFVLVVLALMRKQADEFKKDAATNSAIDGVRQSLEQKIEESAKRVRKEVTGEHEALKGTLSALYDGDRHIERRVITLEQSVAHAPKAADLANLRIEITQLSTNIARFEGAQTEQNRVMRMMHEHMMETGER